MRDVGHHVSFKFTVQDAFNFDVLWIPYLQFSAVSFHPTMIICPGNFVRAVCSHLSALIFKKEKVMCALQGIVLKQLLQNLFSLD